MSATNVFQSKETMPVSGEGLARTDMTLAEARPWGGLPLIGMRKNPNDVVNTRVRPQATGRRP